LVIDEADSMLEDDRKRKQDKKSNRESIATTTLNIKRAIRQDGQVLLFSATFDESALEFARKIAPNAHESLIQHAEDQAPTKNVKQFVIKVRDNAEKLLVVQTFLEQGDVGMGIVFCNTRDDADDISRWLKDSFSFKVEAIHGNLEGHVRDKVIEDFRAAKFNFLVSSNVISRGLDVPQVNFVVNLDLPLTRNNTLDAREYIHRAGRAGRVDRKGISICFATDGPSKDNIRSLSEVRDLFTSYKSKVDYEVIDSSEESIVKAILQIQKMK
jgi:ATP-dependent RNA helicase DDX19/DBP5